LRQRQGAHRVNTSQVRRQLITRNRFRHRNAASATACARCGSIRNNQAESAHIANDRSCSGLHRLCRRKIKRQLAQLDPRRRANRVGHRRRNWRRARLATPDAGSSTEQCESQSPRHLIDAQHAILMEIALIHPAVSQ